LALAALYEGASRTEAARIGAVTVQIVRDWGVKFNAHGPEGLINRKPPGQPSKLTDAHRAALVARVDAGPIPAIHGEVRWRLIDLIQWIWEEFRITISKQTLSRELRAMDYRKLSARPRHHAKSETAVAAFKKTTAAKLAVWQTGAIRFAVELEGRDGQMSVKDAGSGTRLTPAAPPVPDVRGRDAHPLREPPHPGDAVRHGACAPEGEALRGQGLCALP